MNILAFNGSPRLGGNTEILLNRGLEALEPSIHHVVCFRLNAVNLRPCQNCGGCEKTGVCVLDDDARSIHQAIRDADRIILASPIFFLGLSAQTKIMIDRCQPFWCEKYLLKRPVPPGPQGRKGFLLLVGGMTKEIGIQCAGATAKAFFRSISVPEHETMGFLGIDHKGAILEHPTALDDVYHAVRRLLT